MDIKLLKKHINVMPQYSCTSCKKNFERKYSFIKDTKMPFCSSRCYGIWQRGKTFSEQQKRSRPIRICVVNTCNSIHFGKGFCRKHYIQKFYSSSKKERIQISKNPNHACHYCSVEFYDARKEAKFCSQKCYFRKNTKPFILKKGYKKILQPAHPRSDKKGYVFEHITIMEKKIGRNVSLTEEIHHIDHNKLNNSPDNLMLFKNHSEHMSFHKMTISHPCKTS